MDISIHARVNHEVHAVKGIVIYNATTVDEALNLARKAFTAQGVKFDYLCIPSITIKTQD